MERNVHGATYFRFYRNVGIVIYFQWAWISYGVYTSVFSRHSLQPSLKCLQKWQRWTRSRNWPPRCFGRDYGFNEIILNRSPPCSVFDLGNRVGVLALSLGSSRVDVTTSSQLLCHTGCPTHHHGANLPKTKGVRSVSLCEIFSKHFELFILLWRSQRSTHWGITHCKITNHLTGCGFKKKTCFETGGFPSWCFGVEFSIILLFIRNQQWPYLLLLI